MTTHPKKLIEVALPLPEINDASAYDKMPGIGPHPKGIHHWWARLPLPTARAVLFASVVDDPSSHPEKFPTEEAQNAERERLFDIVRELMQKKLHERPDVYAKAREEMLKHTGGKLPPVLDPFAGGGSIPLEAARLGFEAHAADLNPVAVLLNKCNLELVPRWLDRPPVNPEVRGNALRKTGWTGARGLAEDVRYYGNLIRERASAKIGHLYPKVHIVQEKDGTWRHATAEEVRSGKRSVHEATVIAWLWARTVASPNPAAQGAHVPLISTFWLSSKKGKLVWLNPVIDRNANSWRFDVKTGEPPDRNAIKAGTKIARGAKFNCLLTDQPIQDTHVKEQGSKQEIGYRLLAIVAEISKGRIYLQSNEVHEQVPKIDAPDALEEELTRTARGDIWCVIYGLTKYRHLFTPRQLTAMVTLSDLVKDVRPDVLADARKAGLSDAEADDYAKTITTFLALALDRCADFNNALCTWNSSNQKVMHLFGRQAIPMVWDFAEANILGDSVGAWATCGSYVADCIEVLGKSSGSGGNGLQVDAAGAWNDTRGLLVSTDPPYYDNIGYAALSDFFYVWLRRTIGELYPDLFKTILVPKAPELTAAPERFDGNKEKAKEHFESGFRKAFTTLRGKMDSRFPLTVYYAFKQEDEKAGSDEDDNGEQEGASNGVDLTTGWETLLDALLGSGFQITATWPVRASQKWRMVAMGTNALASYIVLACRSRSANAPQCSRREFLNEMKKELPAALKHLQQGNIAPVDLAQAAIGPGMAVFSRYAKVVESSGNAMTVRTALALINQTLDEVLAEQEAEFDADTRWALAWFDQHGMEEGEFGVAETLSRAKNTAVNGLVQAGIVVARSGKVRLVKRNELPEDWDPSSDKRLTVWEATQHLIRALDQHGESGAADLLRKLGGTVGEMARELSYRLHKICEKNSWSSEALAYNSLVLAWPELTRLSQARPREVQRTIFE
jgi:putative DNA methylase